MCCASSEGYDAEDYQTFAVSFLPSSIRNITITQVETKTCQWIQTELEQKELLPHLAEITLILREERGAVLSFGFEEVMRTACVKVTAKWRDESMALQ